MKTKMLAAVVLPQFETGALGALTSPEFGTRIGVNQVTKLTVWPRLELFVQTEPYVHSSDSKGQDKQIHPGEVFLGAQAVIVPGSGAAPSSSATTLRGSISMPTSSLPRKRSSEPGARSSRKHCRYPTR